MKIGSKSGRGERGMGAGGHRGRSGPVAPRKVATLHSEGREWGGLDLSWLVLAFLGRPDFQFRGPKTLENKHLGTSGLKIGAPQNAESNHDGSNPPISANPYITKSGLVMAPTWHRSAN